MYMLLAAPALVEANALDNQPLLDELAVDGDEVDADVEVDVDVDVAVIIQFDVEGVMFLTGGATPD